MKKKKYSFLDDPRALAEIRKHKWIQSQKEKREIGFATAAIDWIDKYGEQWKKIHTRHKNSNSVFIERRKLRRFSLDMPAKLVKDGCNFLADIINISLFGLLCRTKDLIYLGNEVDVYLALDANEPLRLRCRATVERCLTTKQRQYELFLKFDQSSQEQIENSRYFCI